jgi:flavin-dependent dehydrogenase
MWRWQEKMSMPFSSGPMEVDAIVIGGGPAGATAALLLARANWSVAVVEKSVFPRKKVCGEYLSATNQPLWRELGLAEEIMAGAGPEICEVGLFASESILTAKLPRPRGYGWGRALGRDQLDTLILSRAGREGATILQPFAAMELTSRDGEFHCKVMEKGKSGSEPPRTLKSPVVIAAHGSWEPGSLPTQPGRESARPGDLLAFKARFLESALPEELMPALIFPGGYGGMVQSDRGRVTLSCCIRRHVLQQIRHEVPQVAAGEALLAHILAHCRGVREALRNATLEDAWIASGPIRPGIRGTFSNGVFLIGNAAGEAHPIIAEGISMAMQSAWLLSNLLISARANGRDSLWVRRRYAALWKTTFRQRIRVSAVLAHLALKPVFVRTLLPLLRSCPSLLSVGAQLSGKANVRAFDIFSRYEHSRGVISKGTA